MIFQLLQHSSQATKANFHAPIAPGIKLAYCGTQNVCKRNCSGAETECKQQYTFIWQMTIIGGKFFHFKNQ